MPYTEFVLSAESGVLPWRPAGDLLRRALSFMRAVDEARDPAAPRRDPHRELEELSFPLRTAKQLSLLAASPRAADEPFEFAVLGDCEPGRFFLSRWLFNVPGVFERQVASLQAHPIDFSIQLGDMVSRGILRNYLRFFRRVSRMELRRPYLTVIGNHDRHSPHFRSNSRFYRACFGRNNYSFDHGGVRFVIVDSSAHGLNRAQMKWLELVLETDLRKIVFTHIPPANLGCWTDFAGRRGIGGFRAGAAEFTALMSRRRVDRVFMGHIHGFGVQDHGGVRYVLSGGGGSPLFPSGVSDRFHHYIVVRKTDRGFAETVHSLDGGRFEVPTGKVLISS